MFLRQPLAAQRLVRSSFLQSFRFQSTSNTATTVEAVNSVTSKRAIKDTGIADAMYNAKSGSLSKSRFLRSKEANEKVFNDPFVFASSFIVPDKLAGRTVNVQHKDLSRAISQLDMLVKNNKLREISQSQRFFVKPNKRRLAKKVANRKKIFESGIAKLFSVVRDAVRKGY